MQRREFHRGICQWCPALLSLCLAMASAAQAQPTAAEATEAQKSEARRTYEEGKKAFLAGDYQAALTNFEASFNNVASPNSRLMKSRCLYLLGREPEALLELRRTIRDAEVLNQERYRQSAELARQEAAELEKQLASVQVTLENQGRAGQADAAVLTVGGVEIDPEHWSEPIPAKPGRIEVMLRDTSGRTAVRRLDLKAGASASIVVRMGAPAGETSSELTSAQEPLPSKAEDDGMDLRPLGYATGGVGVAGLIAFAVLGTMSNGKFAELEDACPSHTGCDPELRDDANTGRNLQTAANVALVIGAVGVAAGATLVVLGSVDRETELALGAGWLFFRGKL